MCQLVPTVLASAGAASGDIAGVAASGMVPAVVLVDSLGAPLRPAILQNDARAVAEIAQLAGAFEGLDLVELTGSGLTQQSVAPTLLWIGRNEPEVEAAVSWVMGSYDWIASQLGASPHVEQNWAIESGLFSLDGERLTRVLAAAGRPSNPAASHDAR